MNTTVDAFYKIDFMIYILECIQFSMVFFLNSMLVYDDIFPCSWTPPLPPFF